ncbi:phosphoribosylformylglycinamidine synthase subunit PurL [Halocalculus aciditolerans]|uniref:Phosphoribosylformylglycinamidine synthase subunit PurL n=1 Tax=Halocalculus aciditolerans TaxID=1383812 RepID=A0A830F5P2_9EURY|nr:phosphoribosylformylglycinamidine synthase subunit PurL [Halocalculus aciditolerans]GGL57041.1 phosphoribosylformylglycinamidine synthase [Halocalculus aciditolerans]
MPLADADRDLVEAELGRAPSRAEDALFENLWSEHCAYRSSRPLLSAFDSEGEQVVVGPGDDAAVLALDDEWCVTFGVESHNHPSYVDPYDGAATGVGGIVRDTLSMGAYPIALADSLYFGDFDAEHSRYLLDGVVEGIGDYGNAIGVPTVTGSTQFHEQYEGNPLVNVACVGLLPRERVVTAEAQEPGNRLVLVGNSTGRDGLGGASFASEDLAEDAETEDRPAVQVGDPYTEKLLVEANEELVDGGLVESARDLGAAGLGGASCELVAKGGLGCEIALEDVHQREPGMNAMEILLAESQERMVYEVAPGNLDAVEAIAEKYDLGCSVIGDLTGSGRYVATFDGETVVDVPAEFAADGAPMNDLDAVEPPAPETDLPDVALADAADAVLADPNTADKSWVFRQYDHEVGVRTSEGPGEDSALLAIRETGQGLALSAGTNPYWTAVDPYGGAYATAVENATNLAAVGAEPLAAVDCLNGGNPENPDVYGGFKAIVDGLATGCRDLDTPVVGGNVSLYNDSVTGAIPPTPTLAMLGVRDGYDAPGTGLDAEDAALVLVGGHDDELGGSAYLANHDGSDVLPVVTDAAARVDAVRDAARDDATLAVHDVSDGGLLVALAEMVVDGDADAGVDASLPSRAALFSEAPGRAVVQTTDPDALADLGVDVEVIGETTADGTLTVDVAGDTLDYTRDLLREKRDVLEPALD